MSYKIESPIPVVEGGTGVQSNTAYAVLCGGTSTTSHIQSIASVGSAGYLLTSNGAGALPTFQAASGTGFVQTVTGDTGGALSPSAGNINILAGISSTNSGSSVSFAGSGHTLTLDVTDINNNTIFGKNAGNTSVSGTYNTALGLGSLEGLTSGGSNVAIGANAGHAVQTGSYNAFLGYGAGAGYTTSESSNITINANGSAGNSNTLTIGSGTGTGNYEINQAFVSGIYGITPGSADGIPVFIGSGGQLGTVGNGTSLIATLTGNSGGAVSPASGNINVVGGTGVNVVGTPLTNTLTISATNVTTYTNVNTSPYVVLSTDDYLSVDCSGGAITVQLPNAATSGRIYEIKDRTGSAPTHNITVTTVGGAVNIDGATTFVMNTAYQAISVIGNGSTYEIF
jgi:hypothetical protein